MPFITYRNQKVYYHINQGNKDISSNKALILIHGSGENSETWKNQYTLDIGCDVLAIDLPSRGKSEFFEELTLDLYTEVINTLIKELNLEEVILCGHSLGGVIAQQVYFNYPQKIIGLILVGSGARLRVSQFILDSLKNDFQAYLDSIPIGAFYRKTDKEIIEEFVQGVSKVKPEVVLGDFSICNQFDELERVRSGGIKIPMLIICGGADKLTPVKYSKFFEENVQKSQLVIIKNAGHMVMLEKPSEVNDAIENYIKEN